MNNFRGSNQFKDKPKYLGLKRNTYLNVLVLLAFILTVAVIGKHFKNQENITAHYYNRSVAYAQTIKGLTMTPELSEHDQIVNYIKQVFGIHSTDAFKVLSCENHALNPNAINDNTTWGGRGQDIGVMQINNSWQGMSTRFLKNWKINIEAGFQIYKESGYNFHLWTCGRNLEI